MLAYYIQQYFNSWSQSVNGGLKVLSVKYCTANGTTRNSDFDNVPDGLQSYVHACEGTDPIVSYGLTLSAFCKQKEK